MGVLGGLVEALMRLHIRGRPWHVNVQRGGPGSGEQSRHTCNDILSTLLLALRRSDPPG
jgi:hypothetical protein